MRLWDVAGQVCLQLLQRPTGGWGQITCLSWLAADSGQDNDGLCCGTGQGLIIVFRRIGNSVSSKSSITNVLLLCQQIKMKEASSTRAFYEGDPVEAIAYDPTGRRLLVSSHYGTIRMYYFDINGSSVYILRTYEMNMGCTRYPGEDLGIQD